MHHRADILATDNLCDEPFILQRFDKAAMITSFYPKVRTDLLKLQVVRALTAGIQGVYVTSLFMNAKGWSCPLHTKHSMCAPTTLDSKVFSLFFCLSLPPELPTNGYLTNPTAC